MGKNIFFDCGVYTRVQYKDERIKNVFETIISALSSDPCGILFNRELTDKYCALDYEELGFKLGDIESTKVYIAKNSSRIIEAYGHKFIPFYRPKSGFSCILFMPFGNEDKAVVQVVCNNRTKAPYNSKELIQLGREYCATYRGKPLPKGYSQIIERTPTPLGSIIEGVSYQKNKAY